MDKSINSKDIGDLADLERKVNNLSKLVYINGIINSTLDMGKLLTIIMEIIKDIMESEASTLLLYDHAENNLVFKVALGESGKELVEKYRVHMGQGIAGWVAETRKFIYVNDVYRDKRFDPKFDRETGFITKSLACTPLLYKGKLLGVIQAVNPLNRPGFTDDDMELFNVFANQASLAVQNAVYFQKAIEEERINVELESAKSFQDSLIPEIRESFTSIHMAAKSIAAREVGGEFHSLYRIGDNIAAALCDLHKRGIPGGLTAALVSGSLKAFSKVMGDRPVAVLKRLYETIGEDLGDFRNLSLFYGFIDVHNMEIRFINIGAAYPILIRDGIARLFKFKHTVYGGDKENLKQVRLKLRDGDIFLVISDSLMNFKNRSGHDLGLKRIMGFLSGTFSSPWHLIESLAKFAQEFSEGLERREDVSMLAFMADRKAV